MNPHSAIPEQLGQLDVNRVGMPLPRFISKKADDPEGIGATRPPPFVSLATSPSLTEENVVKSCCDPIQFGIQLLRDMKGSRGVQTGSRALITFFLVFGWRHAEISAY